MPAQPAAPAEPLSYANRVKSGSGANNPLSVNAAPGIPQGTYGAPHAAPQLSPSNPAAAAAANSAAAAAVPASAQAADRGGKPPLGPKSSGGYGSGGYRGGGMGPRGGASSRGGRERYGSSSRDGTEEGMVSATIIIILVRKR